MWAPPWVLEQWLQGWSRWAGWRPYKGAGVSSSSGCLLASGTLALLKCGSTSPIFTSRIQPRRFLLCLGAGDPEAQPRGLAGGDPNCASRGLEVSWGHKQRGLHWRREKCTSIRFLMLRVKEGKRGIKDSSAPLKKVAYNSINQLFQGNMVFFLMLSISSLSPQNTP